MPTVLAAEEVWALEVSQVDAVTFVMKALERNSVFNVRQTVMYDLTVANMDVDIQMHFQLF